MSYEDPNPSQAPEIIIPTERDIIQHVKKAVENIQKARGNFEKCWLVNLAYLYGKHYFYVDRKATGGLEERVVWELKNLDRKNKTRRTANYILPLYRSLLARMLLMKAKINTEPLTRAERDIAAARVSQEVLEDFWLNVNKSNPILSQNYNSMLGVLNKLFGCMLITGSAWLQPYFNPRTQAKTVFRNMNNDVETIDDFEVGNVEVEVVNSFEGYPDALQRTFTKKKILSVEDIDTLYGVTIQPESISLTDVEQQIATLMEQGSENVSKYDNSACVYEHYEVPSRKFPQGRFVICTNDKLIQEETLPQECKGRLPFFRFAYLDLMLAQYPQGMVEQLISLQEEYNYTVTRLAEYKKWFAGKVLVPATCNMQTKYDDETGQLIIYTPAGGKPEFAAPPNPPSYLMEEIQRIRRDMEDIAATHDVSMSRTPSGIKSGVAIENLSELDNGQISPVLMHIETQLGFFCQSVLDIMEVRYTEDRLLGLTGDTLTSEVKTFKGENVKGNKRISISLGSGMPTSKQARMELIFRLKAEGMITPEKATELLEFADIDGAFHSLDENVQKTELQEMVNMTSQPQVNDWDNHTVHLSTLDRFLKSDQTKQTDPMALNLIIAHRQQHQQALSAEFQASNSVGQPPAPVSSPQLPPQQSEVM